MRLISQSGYYDISYEHHDITVREPIIHCDKWKVSAFGDNSETEIVIGEYSTEEKALKVMEMIRNEYESIQESNFMRCENAYYVPHTFCMPQESEVNE